MNKFFTLVKKEVLEPLTPQFIAPLVMTAVLFFGLGKVIGNQVEKTKSATKVVVSDFDNTATSGLIADGLGKNNFDVRKYENLSESDVLNRAKDENSSLVLVIPAGFEQGISHGQSQTIKSYTVMRSFSLIGMGKVTAVKGVVGFINDAVSNQLISARVPGSNPVDLKNPVKLADNVVVGEKTASASPEAITTFLYQQTTFIPIILFIVIVFAAQMIATAMATEKENKTLETLLSTPVSRQAIVGSKMVGAALIAFLSSIVYMFGFRSYTSGFTGGSTAVPEATRAALNSLGLVFTTGDYVLLGLSLFAAILVALSIALILGAFTEDVKSVQGAITPLMVLMLIPYFLVMFLDYSALPKAIQYVIYAIPFSHPFLAAPNLYLGNFSQVIYGILYQLIVFLIFLYIATKIFSTDKIMTLKLNFGKKR